jgi:uncharacterized protein (DUF1697 family)
VTARLALLRGINLGRSRRIAMADLRAALEGAGYAGARTHLQSGNVILASDAPGERLEAELEALLGERFGFEVPVVTRTRDELAGTVARNPFVDLIDDPRHLQVSFLGSEPEATAVKELAAADVAPERVAVLGREVYAWHPNGVAGSDLAQLITDRRLGVPVTARNWRTVTKLLELVDALPP